MHFIRVSPGCRAIAKQVPHPPLFKGAELNSGKVMMDDTQRHFWPQDNTPEDSDFGLVGLRAQIAGIANRTTLADGSIGIEHIALLFLHSRLPKEAHRIAAPCHYVLVWAGGGGDDMNKSPHLRRMRTPCTATFV
jgi:dolichyl-diphosphooligosaccharide--protein glycosyltransferase